MEAKEKEKLSKLGSNNSSCAIAANGKFMAVGDRFGQLKIWDFNSGREVSHVQGHDAPVAALALIDDGKVLLSVDRPLSGDRGSVIKRWQVDSWRELAQWQVEPGVMAVTLSPDERILVTVLMNRAIKLWNSADGREFAAFATGPGRTGAGCAFPGNFTGRKTTRFRQQRQGSSETLGSLKRSGSSQSQRRRRAIQSDDFFP